MQDAALPSVDELAAEAARDFAQGDIEATIATLSAASARDPDHMPVVFLTALLAWRLGDAAKALVLARRCFEQASMNGTVAEIVASLYAQTGNLTESLCYGKLAIALPVDATLAAWLPPNFPTFDAAFLTIQKTPLLAQARRLLAAGKLEEALNSGGFGSAGFEKGESQSRRRQMLYPSSSQSAHYRCGRRTA